MEQFLGAFYTYLQAKGLNVFYNKVSFRFVIVTEVRGRGMWSASALSYRRDRTLYRQGNMETKYQRDINLD